MADRARSEAGCTGEVRVGDSMLRWGGRGSSGRVGARGVFNYMRIVMLRTRARFRQERCRSMCPRTLSTASARRRCAMSGNVWYIATTRVDYRWPGLRQFSHVASAAGGASERVSEECFGATELGLASGMG